MIFKRIFIFVVCGTFLVNPLGEVQAETNRQTRLQRIELNAALQRLELNKKTTSVGDLWNKVRDNYSLSESKEASFFSRLNGFRKAPEVSVSEFDSGNGIGYRYLIQDGKDSINVETFEDKNGEPKVRIGKTLFKAQELQDIDSVLTKLVKENRQEVDRQLFRGASKKSKLSLTGKELVKLTPDQRALYYINIRYLVAAAAEVELAFTEKISASNDLQNDSFFIDWFNLLFENSYANQQARLSCVVAGWPTTLLERPRRDGVTCPLPEDTETEPGRQHCGSGRAPCNPRIFGTREGKPHCVAFDRARDRDQANRATLACHQTPPVLDGSVQRTIDLIKSMKAGNESIFNGTEIVDRAKAISELQEIIDATENSIGKCLNVRNPENPSEAIVTRRTEVAANEYVTGKEEEFSSDTSDAKQVATCRVLMSRKTALETTLHAWRTQGSGTGDGGVTCQTTPGGVPPETGSAEVITPAPERRCDNDPVAAAAFDYKPLLFIGGAILAGIGACLIFKIGPCKRKKKTPIQEPVPPIQTPGEPPIPPQPPGPSIPPQPPVGEGGTRIAPPAGGVRQPPPVQQNQQPGAGGIR